MYTVLTITGSPSAASRSTLLAHTLEKQLEQAEYTVRSLRVRDLPAQALLTANTQDPAVAAAARSLASADAVVVATPIYKAAYSGILKAFLDVLPQTALQGKVVLPLATGGSPAHLLAVDYALKPVLAALGARHILSTVYATDAQIGGDSVTGYVLSADIFDRLQAGVRELESSLSWTRRRQEAAAGEVRERLYA